MIVEDCVS